MKLLLVYPEVGAEFRYADWLEIGTAAAWVRANDWHADAVYWKAAKLREEIFRRVRESAPDVLVAVVQPDQAPHAVDVVKHARSHKPQMVTLACGLWPTVQTDSALATGVFDAVLVGEWEPALVDVTSAMSRQGDWRSLPNVAVRDSGGRMTCNSPRPPAEPLDALPPPARDVFPYLEILQINGGEIPLAASRGCPFQCAFCHEPVCQRLQAAPGRAIHRLRDPRAVVAEAEQLLQRFDPERFVFTDSMFPWEPAWLDVFAPLWATQVSRPFTATTALEICPPAVLEALHRAGCDKVVLGIEVGEEAYRRSISNRNSSNAALLQFRQHLDALGMDLVTTNLLGLPGESPEHLEATLQFNRSLDPVEIRTRVYAPVAQTPVAEYIAQQRIEIQDHSLYSTAPDESRLRLPHVSQPQISDMFDRLALLDGVLRSRRRRLEPPAYFDLISGFAEGKLRSPWRRAAAVADWRRGRETRQVLALRAPAEITFDFEARPQSAFMFGVTTQPTLRGLRPRIPVQFGIKVVQDERTWRLFRKFLVPALDPDARRWHDYVFPLREIRPGPCRLVLQVQAGEPQSESQEMPEEVWGGWSNPVVLANLPGLTATPLPIAHPSPTIESLIPLVSEELLESRHESTQMLLNELEGARRELERLKADVRRAGGERDAWRRQSEEFSSRLARFQMLLDRTHLALENADQRAQEAEARATRLQRDQGDEQRRRFREGLTRNE